MCNQNSCNSVTALIVSAIIGVGVSVLFSLSLIPNVIIALWIAFGLSVLSIIALLVLIPLSGFNNFSSLKKCTCAFGGALIIGAVGTFVTTLAALSLTLVVNTALTILFFLIGFFLSFLIISLVQYLWCFLTNDCCTHFCNCDN